MSIVLNVINVMTLFGHCNFRCALFTHHFIMVRPGLVNIWLDDFLSAACERTFSLETKVIVTTPHLT